MYTKPKSLFKASNTQKKIKYEDYRCVCLINIKKQLQQNLIFKSI